jgi:hypothetical protein
MIFFCLIVFRQWEVIGQNPSPPVLSFASLEDLGNALIYVVAG